MSGKLYFFPWVLAAVISPSPAPIDSSCGAFCEARRSWNDIVG